ncbi:MAG: family N-acetyltransferase, partial [Friedmanniella sp.]|nr:family N-acetyltransferase [Friedmanniella sp.]
MQPSDRPEDPTRLDWSPLKRSDLDELNGLITAIEHLDEPDERHSEAELYENFEESGSDPEHETLIGRDSGRSLVAYAWNHPQRSDVTPRRVYCTGGVHPGWRRRGVGHALLRWQLAAARTWCEASWQPGHGPLQALCVVDERVSDQRRLYESVGLVPQRWLADMTRRLDTPPPAPQPVPGVRLVPLRPEWFEAVRLAHNAAFADRSGVQPIDTESWWEQLTRSACRPEWSWLAVTEEGREVVGYALS